MGIRRAKELEKAAKNAHTDFQESVLRDGARQEREKAKAKKHAPKPRETNFSEFAAKMKKDKAKPKTYEIEYAVLDEVWNEGGDVGVGSLSRGFDIAWGAKGIGFGHTVFFREGKKLRCDNEAMSKEFIKAVLCKLVDTAEFLG